MWQTIRKGDRERDLVGEYIKVESGVYANLASGSITEVTAIKDEEVEVT